MSDSASASQRTFSFSPECGVRGLWVESEIGEAGCEKNGPLSAPAPGVRARPDETAPYTAETVSL